MLVLLLTDKLLRSSLPSPKSSSLSGWIPPSTEDAANIPKPLPLL
jgi:hypothetical protein